MEGSRVGVERVLFAGTTRDGVAGVPHGQHHLASLGRNSGIMLDIRTTVTTNARRTARQFVCMQSAALHVDLTQGTGCAR